MVFLTIFKLHTIHFIYKLENKYITAVLTLAGEKQLAAG